MAWRDPYWMPVNLTWLAVMNLKWPLQFNRVASRSGVMGLEIEPSSRHVDRRHSVSVA